MAPARCVAPIPRGELPLPVLPLSALPNNGGPASLGCSFEFKCSQPLVYKNNKSPSNSYVKSRIIKNLMFVGSVHIPLSARQRPVDKQEAFLGL